LSHSLLDELMPRFDVRERHSTSIHAKPAQVYTAIREADLGGGLATRALLALRALPAAVIALVRSPTAAVAEFQGRERSVRLADFERDGFRVVAERPPEEIVIGLLGKFWTPRGALCADVSRAHFADGPPPGFALAGWNFEVKDLRDGTCELRTETRVLCDADARRAFTTYWLFVRPGSGLIRRAMLRAIRHYAENQAT
jgi:hypothetical protein